MEPQYNRSGCNRDPVVTGVLKIPVFFLSLSLVKFTGYNRDIKSLIGYNRGAETHSIYQNHETYAPNTLMYSGKPTAKGNGELGLFMNNNIVYVCV